MTNIFKSIIRCDDLRIQDPYEGVCFGHVFPSPTNMPMLIIKVNISLQLVGIKVTQSTILFLDFIDQFDQRRLT